jgi:OmpA-OmpF porin, OOP family
MVARFVGKLGLVLVAWSCGCGGAQSQEPVEVVQVANLPPAPASAYAPGPPAQEEPPAPRPVAAPSGSVRQEGNKLKLPEAVVFEVGKTTIKPQSEAVLTALRDFLAAKTQISLLRIEGHSDNRGASAMNLQLSGTRALAIRDWLIAQGIDASRLVAVGFGDTKPVADNATEEGRMNNRRIEYVVVEVGGRPWLGADPIGGGTVFGSNPRP